MEYRNLGRSGLMVSPLCIGTMLFGGLTNKKTADAILGSARDAGINFIDSASSYTGGKSESMIGELLAKDRDKWVLATAVAGRADVLVTGDSDLLEVAPKAPLPIMTPRDFWKKGRGRI